MISSNIGTVPELYPCEPDACRHGGTCYKTAQELICHCMPGYTGSVCEIDINECESNPCGNANYANSCVDKVNGYECNCRSCDCSTIPRTAHCAINETAACIEHSKKPKYSGSKDFYLGHPYRCEWMVRCFSGRGVSTKCAPPLLFNPDHASGQPCSKDVHCIQT
ncbi:hypothetical protein LSAT2_000922 [Lamellibrachia satsuma]|nr:hypothetical protein LSAT2_000922 [Lamellibrachia satsuma]